MQQYLYMTMASGPEADLHVVVKPHTCYNVHTHEFFWLVAYSAGYVMYPDTTETSAFVAVTKEQADADEVRNRKAMEQLCREAVSRGATQLIIYNFDGRDAKMHTFKSFVVRDKEGRLYPKVQGETREKLTRAHAAKDANAEIVFLNVTDCVLGYNAACREKLLPEDVFIAAEITENKIVRFVTRIITLKFTDTYLYCEHHPDVDAEFSYKHLVGAGVTYTKPKVTRSGRCVIEKACIMPTLKGEADRRQRIEQAAALKAASLIGNLDVIYRYMPIPDWGSATAEQYAGVAWDAMTFGVNTMVAMHCASSFGRTGGMIQTVVAATSAQQFSDPSTLADTVNGVYDHRNSELRAFGRPGDALSAGNLVQSYRDVALDAP